MTAGPARRLAGWVVAGVSAAALLSAAAVMALGVDRPQPVLILDLGQLPPSAPSFAAIAEPAPQVDSAALTVPDAPVAEEKEIDMPVSLPVKTPRPLAPAPLSLPLPEAPVIADIALPPPAVKPSPPSMRPRRRPERPAETAEPKPASKPAEPVSIAAAAPSGAAAREASMVRAGGTRSPAAYLRAVLKKVHATRKMSGVGRGTAVIGFSLAPDGALVSVQVLHGSGSERLDRAALDHIRRSAPFPPAPAGVGRSFSFEFVGR